MIGTIYHYPNGAVAAGIHYDAPFKSTLKTRRYTCGLEQPNYPMPAIQLEVMFPWYWFVDFDLWNATHIFIVEVTKRWDDGSFTGPTVYVYPPD